MNEPELTTEQRIVCGLRQAQIAMNALLQEAAREGIRVDVEANGINVAGYKVTRKWIELKPYKLLEPQQ